MEYRDAQRTGVLGKPEVANSLPHERLMRVAGDAIRIFAVFYLKLFSLSNL